MATRANIELYDGAGSGKYATLWRKGVVLYHHWDGYPSWMGPELTQKLAEVKAILGKRGHSYWWDSERVGALLIALSNDTPERIPRFQPCLQIHGDIDFIWRIFLGPKSGQYEIQCLEVCWDWAKGVVKQLEPVDWRAEAEQEEQS